MKVNKFNEIRSYFTRLDQIGISVLILLIIVLFAPTFSKLINNWYSNPDSSHGFFVIPISLYMVWMKRDQLFEIERKTSWAGLLLLILSLATYFVSFAVRFNTLLNLSIIFVIFGMVLFLTGWKITRALLFPIVFLIFMIPIPNEYEILITNPLKLWITYVSASLLNLLGIPVLQDGNLMFFANYQLEVAEACSGVRSVISYLMLGFFFAILSRKMLSKVIIILSTIPLAITVNIIRVTSTGFLAAFFGERVAKGFFHEFTGIVLFIIGMIVLFMLHNLLEGRKPEKNS